MSYPVHKPCLLIPSAACTGPQLQLLQLDNCLYLVRRDALQSRLEQLSSTDGIPKYVTVCNTSKDCCLAVAPESEVQVTSASVQLDCMLDACIQSWLCILNFMFLAVSSSPLILAMPLQMCCACVHHDLTKRMFHWQAGLGAMKLQW